jgi:hypothetical protein
MHASPQQKTMIAQPSPFAHGGMPQGMPQGGMPQGGMPQGGMPQGMPQGGMPQGGMPQQGGFAQASPMQKTIVAGMAPPIAGGQMMQPGPYGYPPTPGGPAAPAPNKTVMLQPSEGVVSVARTGQAVQPAGTGAVQQGASTLFWIVSLVIGVAVGALGYVVVLQL